MLLRRGHNHDRQRELSQRVLHQPDMSNGVREQRSGWGAYERVEWEEGPSHSSHKRWQIVSEAELRVSEPLKAEPE